MAYIREQEKYNDYMREYMAARYKKRRLEALERLGGKCACCGSTEGLEFDHIDPATKKYTIARIWMHSQRKFEEEIGKCQLLCRKCHEAKTIRDLGFKLAKGTHGTLSAYRYCKCELCRKAKADYAHHNYLKRMQARAA